MTEHLTAQVERIAKLAAKAGVMVGAAESLTSGQVAATLGAGPDAADWFAGSVVAYQEKVKFDLLGVPEGPVVTHECAREMARGARRVLQADLAVSTTGVGGPDPSEGKPAGTVVLAVASDDSVKVTDHRFDGEPEEVLEQTVSVALELVERRLREIVGDEG